MRIHLYLPDEAAAILARLSRQRGLSRSEIVAEALQRYDYASELLGRLDRIEHLLAGARVVADKAAPDAAGEPVPAQTQALDNLRSWATPDDD